ncbi:MAG: RNA-binding S4 domain-containing protein [Flavobacteriales bacterium]|jgi:ribosome-associated protein|nr:RNA-binding S4 domain-containing protein [Flavobacteriales bacterium]
MAEQIEFSLRTPYIDLLQLLKATGLCATGGEAKWAVEEERVKVNGESELRKRRKLRHGDLVELDGEFFVRISSVNPT